MLYIRGLLELVLCLSACAYVLAPSLVLAPKFARTIIMKNGVRFPPTSLTPFRSLDAEISDHWVQFGKCFMFGRLVKNRANADSVVFVCAGRLSDVGSLFTLVKSLLNVGHSVFVFDYVGVGRSKGNGSFSNMLKGSLACYDYVRNQLGYHDDKICIYGFSLGGWPAAYVSARRTHSRGALVLQSTGDDMVGIGKLQKPILRVFLSALFRPRLNNRTLVRRNRRPYFGLHGVLDDFFYISSEGERAPGFPIRMGKTLAALCPASCNPRFYALPNSVHSAVWLTDPELWNEAMVKVLEVIS